MTDLEKYGHEFPDYRHKQLNRKQLQSSLYMKEFMKPQAGNKTH